MSFDYGKYFGEIKLTHDLLSKKEERTWLLKPPRDGERHDVVLYLGCNVLRTSHLVYTVGAVFDRLGLAYLVAGGPGMRGMDLETGGRWGRTCTAGLQEQLGPEVWRQMALDDIDRARAAGATHLAGIYHGCHRDQCRFERERPIVVEHYLTLFARALGIEFEDTYKKYMHMGDADRILEDASPGMAANGVDPRKERGLVIKTFSS